MNNFVKFEFSICYFSINCLCGNRIPENNQKVADSDCDVTCVGNPSQTCGGEDRIQIYNIISKKLQTIAIILYSFVQNTEIS